MKIAILTRQEDASPKVLAKSLKSMLTERGVNCNIYSNPGFLMRRVPIFGKIRQQGKFHFTIRRYLKNYLQDFFFISKLGEYDAIVVSDCEPNGFWNNHFGIEKLKKLLRKPIIFHEVYYLGNMPSHIKKLKKKGHPTLERYDWHLAVSEVAEIRSNPMPPWSCIGLYLKNLDLNISTKEYFFAIVDFKKKGFERYRQEQIEVLKELDIPYVSFEERLSIDEIRDYYKKSSIFFLQSPETFGVPIAECLACGTAVFTPSSSWPMAWRLDKDPSPNEEGILPNCFHVYTGKNGLKNAIIEFKTEWNSTKAQQRIFKTFLEYYPHFYKGNVTAIDDFIDRIRNKRFN